MEVQTVMEQLLFTTVRIEADTPRGNSTGTAFIFSYLHDDGRHWDLLVTNKHVIADATEGRFFFTKGKSRKPLTGQRHDFHVTEFQTLWHGHPDAYVDIAVAPLDRLWNHMKNKGMEIFATNIPSSFIPGSEQAADLDAVEDVMFVGYPNGIYDVKNLMPIVRRESPQRPSRSIMKGNRSSL